jgi:hypothetical protein
MTYPKFTVTESTMKKLFASGGFFHTCRQEDILSVESTWHICKSSDGKFLLLVQVLHSVSTTLASLHWEDKPYSKTTNPWLIKNDVENTSPQHCIIDFVDAIIQPTHKKFQLVGMNDW